jgi:hypothetical protein
MAANHDYYELTRKIYNSIGYIIEDLDTAQGELGQNFTTWNDVKDTVQEASTSSTLALTDGSIVLEHMIHTAGENEQRKQDLMRVHAMMQHMNGLIESLIENKGNANVQMNGTNVQVEENNDVTTSTFNEAIELATELHRIWGYILAGAEAEEEVRAQGGKRTHRKRTHRKRTHRKRTHRKQRKQHKRTHRKRK